MTPAAVSLAVLLDRRPDLRALPCLANLLLRAFASNA